MFEAFMPFSDDRGRKTPDGQAPSLANVALFAPTEVVERAQQLFRDQVGHECDDSDLDEAW